VSPHTRLDYSSFGFFSHLFESYCSRFDALAEFYSIDYRLPSAHADAADNTLRLRRDRKTLADVLAAQNARWNGGARTSANIDRLRDPSSVAVVTGQQVGLFTGPLYTIYKIITTIQLAREMERRTGRATIPVFWLEAEDHDFDEANRATFSRGAQAVTVSCPGKGTGGPVGRIIFSEAIRDVLDQVRDMLPPTDFREEVLRLLGAAYEPGVTYLDAFARMLNSMLPDEGLVLISSDDERLKQSAAPLIQKEASDFESFSSAATDG
jgi:bacillithiol biosynthesis cysteine-adding enzyme BshC